MTRVVRVDLGVYRYLLQAKHLLEDATQQIQSMNTAVSFLMALKAL